jgi:predicted membrane-bound spermidine synthase
MSAPIRRLLFLLFFVSGFCGLVYQVVWTRLAFASFGIITPVLSIVISTFMAGLSLGAWAAGRWIENWVRRTGLSAIFFYSLSEVGIGVGAFAVPVLFATGERILLNLGQSNSVGYLLASALILAISLLPWCLFMGTTFPLMMAYVREKEPSNHGGFSFLYLANVLGAMAGTILAALVLVECLGFRRTLWVAAAGNFSIALVGAFLGRRSQNISSAGVSARERDVTPTQSNSQKHFAWILFCTGFSAMAMEVVWMRLFTPVLKTQVYSFALVVFMYLGATAIGSWWYRRHLRTGAVWGNANLIAFLAAAALLPLAAVDSRIVKMEWAGPVQGASVLIVLASIAPICGLLGYLTPSLIDGYSNGDPEQAGKAYAINVFGCILGPLFACYFLLPCLSEKAAVILLCLPFCFFFVLGWKRLHPRLQIAAVLGTIALTFWTLVLSDDFQSYVASFAHRVETRRDHVATVISADPEPNKILLVNGMGMTYLTPVTKFMIHLPLALHKGPVESALVICFGMGTTFRSALSWDIDTTAVELVPGVTKAFGFYHSDADRFVKNPKGHIIIDDGRRYLRRTQQKFDAIVVDPPPPVSAAGSSLLFSREFCALARDRLKPQGIVQIWFPDGKAASTNLQTGAISDRLVWETRRKQLAAQATAKSMSEIFPHVRIFLSAEHSGIHLLASMAPIEIPDREQLATRLPPGARRDLMEWNSSGDVACYLGMVAEQEIPLQNVLNSDPRIEITDDSPLNEYFLLRQLGILR